MKNTTVLNQTSTFKSDELLKLTALAYFEEALAKEEYENCAELVENARKFGAEDAEIKGVITTYIKNKSGGKSGANPKSRLK